MKKLFNLFKKKENKNTQKEKKFKFSKLLKLIAAALIVNIFSGLLGKILFVVACLYTAKNLVIPGVKKLYTKYVNFFKNLKYGNLETNEYEDEFENEYEDEFETAKTNNNAIKNLNLNIKNKFLDKFSVKRDVNGEKIVDGEYRIKGDKIIQDEIIPRNISTMSEKYNNQDKVLVKRK